MTPQGETREALRAALGFDTPWPVTAVLRRLADAVDHLLNDHDCDQHGWEGVTVARDRARVLADELDAVLSTAEAEEKADALPGTTRLPECDGSPCSEDTTS